MANLVVELDPVTHITAGAIGPVGQRTFFIQARRGPDQVDLLCEKEHVQALADAVDELFAKLESELNIERYSDLEVDEAEMKLKEPVDPLFRVGAMGLGYDAGRDRVLLVAQELVPEDEDRDPREARFFATRSQMQALADYGRDVVGRGRAPEIRALQVGAYVRRNGHED
jgi:uncharacterized repeat protein (TIGR03847 family)